MRVDRGMVIVRRCDSHKETRGWLFPAEVDRPIASFGVGEGCARRSGPKQNKSWIQTNPKWARLVNSRMCAFAAARLKRPTWVPRKTSRSYFAKSNGEASKLYSMAPPALSHRRSAIVGARGPAALTTTGTEIVNRAAPHVRIAVVRRWKTDKRR